MAELLDPADPFPEKNDWYQLETWFGRRLEGRSLAQVQLLAGRAALRNLPFLHRLLNLPRKKSEKPAVSLLLDCLRCCPVSAGAALVPPAEIARFRNVAAAAAATNAHFTSAAVAAAEAGAAVSATAYFAATAVLATAHFASAADAAAADAAATAAFIAVNTAAAADVDIATNRASGTVYIAAFATAGIPAYYGAAFAQDCRIVDAVGIEQLARARLWQDWDSEVADAFLPLMPENHRFNPAPKAFRDELAQAVPRLRDLPGDFAVWLEWYDGIQQGEKNGRYLFGLPTERALRLNVEIALIDETFWKDPAKVNAEIRRLVEVARGETTRNSKPEPAGTGRSSSGKPTEREKRQKAKPENRSKRPKPKSEVGKVFLANAATLALQAHLLIALIDEELRQLGDQRPNSQEEIDKKAASIAALEKVKANTIALRDSAVAFPNGEVSEEQVVKKVNAFFKPFRDMWSEKGKELAESSCRTGLFLGAMAIAPYCGVPITAGALILGAITAGKPLAEVLKASKGVFKIT